MEGFVYLLCDGEKFKIGMTKQNDIYKRIAELQTGNSNEIFISAYHKTKYPFKLEKMLHNKFINKRVHGEWFSLNAYEVSHFNDICKQQLYILESLKNNPFVELK